ncbi:MAG: ATP-dependent helicase [Cyanobacteria bacterium TGS_CYA1]|nr:ATP-dependent helicase [Cyanobacteria bacterium TGS_CYA1]
MKLSNEQREAVTWDGNIKLTACPGSGKTTALVAKVLETSENLAGSFKRIACITYTNAAVNEIKTRLHKLGPSLTHNQIDVTTIHTFCINNILRPFHWRIPHLNQGFSVAAPDSEPFIQAADQVNTKLNLRLKSREPFELLNRAADGSPISRDIPKSAALAFWELLSKQNLVDFPNIVFESWKLLEQFPNIGKTLSAKYFLILVDEFQDTSEVQVEILKNIHQHGKTKFFLVGDSNQSIFSFAGSKPELFDSFSKFINAREDIGLFENFRSSEILVKHAELLLPTVPGMIAAGANKNFGVKPVHIEVNNFISGVTEYYLPALEEYEIPLSKAAILAPWWLPLFELAQSLRGFDIPVVGPGARPYGPRNTFGLLCEDICGYIVDRKPSRLSHVSSSLESLLMDLEKVPPTFSKFKKDLAVVKLMDSATRIRLTHEAAIDWMREAAREFAEILVNQELMTESNQKFLTDSVNQMQAVMEKRKIDLNHFTVEQLGIFASPDKNMKLLNLHSCKGREFEAVAIVEVHDDKIPYGGSQIQSEIEESRRLFYVGATRAKKLLMCFGKKGKTPSRFLNDYLYGI